MEEIYCKKLLPGLCLGASGRPLIHLALVRTGAHLVRFCITLWKQFFFKFHFSRTLNLKFNTCTPVLLSMQKNWEKMQGKTKHIAKVKEANQRDASCGLSPGWHSRERQESEISGWEGLEVGAATWSTENLEGTRITNTIYIYVFLKTHKMFNNLISHSNSRFLSFTLSSTCF